jgi:hypothetical protein
LLLQGRTVRQLRSFRRRETWQSISTAAVNCSSCRPPQDTNRGVSPSEAGRRSA